MSSNYDMEPLRTPPWWPGVMALVIMAVMVMGYLFIRY